uniref:Uncharacterized protein n=1 Tax=Meloidogyne javanica TaxID=6303 RepID=A0A915LRQ7_MELJA
MKILNPMNLKLLFYCLCLILFLISCVDGMPLRGSRSSRRRSSVIPEAMRETERNAASDTIRNHGGNVGANVLIGTDPPRRGVHFNGNIPLADQISMVDDENYIDFNFDIQHEDEVVEAPTPFSNSDGSEGEENQSSSNSPDHNSVYGDNKEPLLYNDAEIHHTGASSFNNHEAGSSSNTLDHDYVDYEFEGNELVYNLQNMHLRQGGGIQHNTRANQHDMHGPISNSSRNKHRVQKQHRHKH